MLKKSHKKETTARIRGAKKLKTIVLVFHPNINESKVNKKMAMGVEKLDGVLVRYLYDIYSDGQINVTKEQELLEKADRIVLQFPVYWYSSPSLLKQWQDEVLSYGWAFGSSGNKLHGKELLLVVSPGATEDNYQNSGAFKYTLNDLLRPFQATSNLVGTKYIKPFITYGASSISNGDLDKQTEKYLNYLSRVDLDRLDTFE